MKKSSLVLLIIFSLLTLGIIYTFHSNITAIASDNPAIDVPSAWLSLDTVKAFSNENTDDYWYQMFIDDWRDFYPYQIEYTYEPKEDITIYELSVIIPILIAAYNNYHAYDMIENLPDNVKRHFRLSNYYDLDRWYFKDWSDFNYINVLK